MLRSLSCLALGLTLAACGGSTTASGRSTYSPASNPGGHASPSAFSDSAVAESSQSAESPPMTPAPSSEARAESGAAFDSAPSQSRPGLGTEWGEARASRVSSSPFEREDWNRPAVAATLFYNDENGVRAMTRGAELSSFASGGVSIAGGALSVRLLDGGGSVLPSFDLGRRTYVMGSHGERYMIQIQNHTGSRFEAVATVDGLDVIDGQPGSFEKRGYLINPWASVEIEGFRHSMDQVAAFRFGSVSHSYAARKGDDRNVGVIGVAFFAERGVRFPLLDREVERRHDADPFPGRFASPPFGR